MTFTLWSSSTDYSLLGSSKHEFFFSVGSSLNLSVHSDADRAGCPDPRRSMIGWCMFLGNAPVLEM